MLYDEKRRGLLLEQHIEDDNCDSIVMECLQARCMKGVCTGEIRMGSTRKWHKMRRMLEEKMERNPTNALNSSVKNTDLPGVPKTAVT